MVTAILHAGGNAMARRADSTPRKALSRVAGAVKRTAKKVTARLHRAKPEEVAVKESRPRLPHQPTAQAAQPMARKRRPQTDVPVDALVNAYAPAQTSLTGPFRANGAPRQRDQEMSRGVADDRWNDEDHLTNKSGDPRIGTHGRTYEPGESRIAKGRK